MANRRLNPCKQCGEVPRIRYFLVTSQMRELGAYEIACQSDEDICAKKMGQTEWRSFVPRPVIWREGWRQGAGQQPR